VNEAATIERIVVCRATCWHSTSAPLLGVALIIGAFAGLALQNLQLPGLYNDEMIQVVPALNVIHGGMPSPVSGTEISLFHHAVPIMTMDYIGSLKTLLFVPVVALAGVSPESVRVTTLSIGATSLVVTFAFFRRMVPAPVALLAAALLATDLSFIYYVRVDYGPTALMMLLKAVALWRLAAWWQEARVRDLAVGALALGLGVYNKVDFLWIVGALGGAVCLAAPRAARSRITMPACCIGFACFMLGTAPLTYFNLRSGMPTLAAALGPATAGGPPGDFVEQLAGRIVDLGQLVDGYAVGICDRCLESHGHNELALILIFSSALIAIAGMFPKLRGPHWRVSLFALIATALVLAAAAATRGGYGGHHVILAYPFPQLLAACGVYSVFQWLRPRLGSWITRTAAALVIGATLLQNLATANGYISLLSSTGGTGNFSDAIYALDSYLQRQDPSAPVVDLDWGFYYPLVGLSQGSLHVVEPWNWYMAGSTAELKPFLADPSARYVAHVSSWANFPRGIERFTDAVAAAGLQAVLEEQFTMRDGAPVIDVYRVREPL